MILPGNASCQGCPISLAMRCLDEIENPVVAMPAGCSTVIAGLHPNSAMKLPVVHVPFASTPAVACGLSEAYKRGGIKANVIAWMGDGAADIGFAVLSASAIRNDDIIVIVVDNEAYMNTGTQASLSTPFGARTTTSPMGKKQGRRNLGLIMVAHRANYVATATVGFIHDLRKKFKKAGKIGGFRFLHVHTPCPPGWKFPSDKTIEVARLAVKTGAWVLYEYENGKIEFSEPGKRFLDKKNRLPLKDYIRMQGRFTLRDEEINIIEEEIDEEIRILSNLKKSQNNKNHNGNF
ncbi:MAG: thiamine pyrophosphate-dependent enzyme [Archaeoglobaceae archaeon]|nr:thiamine pyrophosphate-dependent enzyme [Archaeoglobaceae archaeon]MDW7989741.1 thiamine pyrophosphate-dependent enzyme [Archaeoglobaceae archaeon]